MIINPYIFGGFDPDAQAFITAANITNNTQRTAINQLVLDLKAYNIWSKMKAIYPFVGGTASTHKFNLKDPRDLDVAFRLVFNGGWTHSSTGALPNGTNGYADTKLNASSNLGQFSTSMSYYSRTINDGPYTDAGAQQASNLSQRIVLNFKYSGVGYYDQNDTGTGRLSVNMSSINSNGLFLMSRTANNIQKAFRNGSQIGSTNNNTISTLLPTSFIWLGAYNGSIPTYTNRECAFATIGDGFTDTDATNLYNTVQTFQTSLSRQV